MVSVENELKMLARLICCQLGLCQSFSNAGDNKGFDDEKATLF